MNCEQARELLPVYVLGALDLDETREVEAHLRAGHEHDEELVELRATVFALDRFAVADALEPASRSERRPLPLRIPEGTKRTELRDRPSFSPARRTTAVSASWLIAPAWRTTAVAASVAIALFAAGWFASGLGGGAASHDVSVAIQGPAGQSVLLAGATSEKHVSVSMSGFPRLDSDRVYQFWAIRDGTWTRIGVCNPKEDGAWSGEFPFAIRSGEQIALTIEPAGGSDAPTSPPVLLSTA